MNNKKILIATFFSMMVTALLSGCNEKPAIASPSCADLEKIIDPAKKNELQKKCPRNGPAFKPSEDKKW